MELTLQSIQESGGFAPARPEQREITWLGVKDGKPLECTATVYIRKKSFNTVSIESQAFNAKADVVAARIAASVVDAKGKPIFTVDDITGTDERGPMCESLSMALLGAIADVNGYSKAAEEDAGKNLPTPMNSGANSSSQASAAKPSNKPKRT